MLVGKDITEISEFAQDKFIVGLWSENDFLTIDRTQPKKAPEIIK